MGKSALLKTPNKVLRDTFMLQGNLVWIDLSKLRKWHDEQCSADTPDVPMWRRYYDATRTGLREEFESYVKEMGMGSLFHDLAKSLDHSEVKSLYAHDAGIASFLVKIMDWGVVKAYFVDDERIAFVLKDGNTVEVRIVYDRNQERCGELCHPDCVDLFDAALNNWVDWREENGPTRHPLCHVMAKAIALLSEEAGRVFDQAVAVSRDGRRILEADEVVSYEFGSKKALGIALHTGAEFQNRKILLGKTHIVRLKPRKKSDQERIRGLLNSKTIEKYVFQSEVHGCRQCVIEVGETRIFITPQDTVPSQVDEKPAEPLFPRKRESVRPANYESTLDPENAILDGIAPNPFQDDMAGGGLIGPPYEEGGDRFDMDAPVFQTAEHVDCTDPAQKPPQRIESEIVPNPDAPKAEPSETKVMEVQDEEPRLVESGVDPEDAAEAIDSPPSNFAYRIGGGIVYGAPVDIDDILDPGNGRHPPPDKKGE